jgi:glycogen synthase
MKVTFLTWEYPPHVYGGAGVHVNHLVGELRKRVEIEVRTLGNEGATPSSEQSGVHVRRYRPWNALTGSPSTGIETLLRAFSVDLAFVNDPLSTDIVHTHTWYTNLAGFYAKNLYDVKLVATVHSLEPKRPWKEAALGNAYRLSTWAERTCLRHCDQIIAVSNAQKQDIVECYDVDDRRVEVIPNGVDANAFRRREDHAVLERYGVRKPYVLFLGRLSRQKGVLEAVAASSRLPDGVTLVLVTGKADERRLEVELSSRVKNSDRIVWVNKMLTESEAVAFYSGCEVFISPSRYEPFGIINLEAMACSRPVVSTNVGGIKDVVVDGITGVLIEPQNPVMLADAINAVLADGEKAARLGRNGRKRVEQEYSWEKVADSTLTLYQTLL